MIGKAYSFAKSAIGKAFRVGNHYLDAARHIGKSLTPFYHQSGLSSIPMVRDVVDTTKNILSDYDSLRRALNL